MSVGCTVSLIQSLVLVSFSAQSGEANSTHEHGWKDSCWITSERESEDIQLGRRDLGSSRQFYAI